MANIELGIINADGTNRHPDLNNYSKLASELNEVIRNRMFDEGERNGFITISEIGSTASCKLNSQLPECYEYCFARFKSKDGIACLWDDESWAADYSAGRVNVVWSDVGKYTAITVENQLTKKRLLYASVHLPKRNLTSKKKSLELLQKLVEDSTSKEIDGVIIAGDFNTEPSELRRSFSSLSLKMGICSDEIATTRAKNSIDNVVTSDSITPVVEVYDDYKKLTHFPLFAKLTLED